MISWIQTTFQKHTKFFLFFLLIVITIPFVFTIGAAPGIGNAGPKMQNQEFFGTNLGNEGQARRIFRDASFSAQIKGAFQATGPQLQQYALNRAAGLHLAQQLGLPVPDEKQVAAHIAQLPTFKDDAGNFDQLRYQQFADSLKGNREFSAADANRVLRDDTRLAALSRLLAGPGYVLNGDVAEQLKRVDTTWNITVASIDYASYSPTVAVTDAALQKFYDDNSFRYDIPARARLQLVEFKATEFIPTSNPSEHDARAYYNANAARFPAPTDASANAPSFALGESATAVTDNFPKVRLQVEAAMKEDISRRAASRAANDFTIALFERKVAANSSELGAFISASRRSAVNLAPFTFDAPPADRAWLANYAEQINRLNANRYFSDPLPTPEGFVVMLWQETVPAYKPMLSEARARVAADFTESEKRRQFTEHGKALRERLLANVKSGKSFAEAAAAAKLEVKSYAEFTLREPPQDLPYAAFGALQTLQAGELSEMVSTGEKGQFTFVVAKKLPDTSTSSARFAEVRKQLMQYTAAANESAILAALVEDELKRSQPDTP